MIVKSIFKLVALGLPLMAPAVFASAAQQAQQTAQQSAPVEALVVVDAPAEIKTIADLQQQCQHNETSRQGHTNNPRLMVSGGFQKETSSNTYGLTVNQQLEGEAGGTFKVDQELTAASFSQPVAAMELECVNHGVMEYKLNASIPVEGLSCSDLTRASVYDLAKAAIQRECLGDGRVAVEGSSSSSSSSSSVSSNSCTTKQVSFVRSCRVRG